MVFYECKSCNYSTKLKGNYTRHLDTQKCKINSSKELSKNFKCTNCEATFRDNYGLSRHINKKVPCTTVTNTVNEKGSIINNGTIETHDVGIKIHIQISDTTADDIIAIQKGLFSLMDEFEGIDTPERIEKFKSDIQNMLIEENIYALVE